MKSWTPTRLNFGEGCTWRGSNRQMHPLRSTGVVRSGRSVTAADPHPIHRIPARPSREGRRYSPTSPGQPTVLARALTEPPSRECPGLVVLMEDDVYLGCQFYEDTGLWETAYLNVATGEIVFQVDAAKGCVSRRWALEGRA